MIRIDFIINTKLLKRAKTEQMIVFGKNFNEEEFCQEIKKTILGFIICLLILPIFLISTDDSLVKLIMSTVLITLIPLIKIQELKQNKMKKEAQILKFTTKISAKVAILVNCGMNPQKALELTLKSSKNYSFVDKYIEEMYNCLIFGMSIEKSTLEFCLYAREEYVLRFFSLLVQTQKGGNLHLKTQLIQLTNQIYIDKNLYFMKKLNESEMKLFIPLGINLITLLMILVSPLFIEGIK